jgi:hypothetical protein
LDDVRQLVRDQPLTFVRARCERPPQEDDVVRNRVGQCIDRRGRFVGRSVRVDADAAEVCAVRPAELSAQVRRQRLPRRLDGVMHDRRNMGTVTKDGSSSFVAQRLQRAPTLVTAVRTLPAAVA